MTHLQQLTDRLAEDRNPGADIGKFLAGLSNSPDFLEAHLERFLQAVRADKADRRLAASPVDWPPDYRGTARFDREQLVFFVHAVLNAALEQVEDLLPHLTTPGERPRFGTEVKAAMKVAASAIAFVCHELSDEDLFNDEVLEAAGGFENACRLLFVRAWEDPDRASTDLADLAPAKLYPGYYPDARKHAEVFVDDLFADYLAGPDRPAAN